MRFKRLPFLFLTALSIQGVFAAEAVVEDASPENSAAVQVVFETTMGSFTLELNAEKAPKTVANFLAYVDQGFYSNTLFHRVIPGFVIQGGGFEKGMRQKETMPPVENESDNGLKNTVGTISMARTRNPNSATSQFFINVNDNVNLDASNGRHGYAVFGEVTEGMDVVHEIVAVPTKTVGPFQDVPAEDIEILSATRKEGHAPSGE